MIPNLSCRHLLRLSEKSFLNIHLSRQNSNLCNVRHPNRFNRQYEAIETGVIELKDVGERIRELKSQREKIEASLQELKKPRAIPLHFFKDESIASFQQSIKNMFTQCDDRRMVKRYLQLFISKIVISLTKVEILDKPEVVLAVLENKKAVRTGEVLTAVGAWLPSTDSNRGPSG